MAAPIAIPRDQRDEDHVRINLSVTLAEKRVLAEAAERSGLPVCELIRRRVFDGNRVTY